jgi:hypothetical protein
MDEAERARAADEFRRRMEGVVIGVTDVTSKASVGGHKQTN